MGSLRRHTGDVHFWLIGADLPGSILEVGLIFFVNLENDSNFMAMEHAKMTLSATRFPSAKCLNMNLSTWISQLAAEFRLEHYFANL